MVFPQNGSLTTDKRTVNDSEGWSTQNEWEGYQTKNQTEIVDGGVQLREIQGIQSAIHKWPYSEGSGSTAADTVGNADGNIDGATWVSGDWEGGYALSGDGNDFVNVGTLGSFGSQLTSTSGWAIIFTLETGSNDQYFGVGSGDTRIWITAETSQGFQSGKLNMRIRDNNANNLRFASNTTISDGTRRRCVINAEGGDLNNWEIWLNGSEDGSTIDLNDPVSPTNFTDPFYHMGASGGSFTTGIIDNVILSDEKLTQTEIENDYNIQPWS